MIDMGASTNAMLLYGFSLGSDEEWLLEDAGRYGELPYLEWFDSDSDDDFIAAAERRLLVEVAGFTETDWKVDGFYARQLEAEARLGVKLRSHCSDDYPMWVLSASDLTAHRGDVLEIDPARLLAGPAENDWDAKLTAALTALGIRPKQQKPAWLLCSYWG